MDVIFRADDSSSISSDMLFRMLSTTLSSFRPYTFVRTSLAFSSLPAFTSHRGVSVSHELVDEIAFLSLKNIVMPIA